MAFVWICSSMALYLLQKDPSSTVKPTPATKLEDAPSDFSRIRCPQCKWQPKAHHLWQCTPCATPEYFQGGCGTLWHTFDTKGKCPGCKYQWKYTKCMFCSRWSLHQEWYVKSDELN